MTIGGEGRRDLIVGHTGASESNRAITHLHPSREAGDGIHLHLYAETGDGAASPYDPDPCDVMLATVENDFSTRHRNSALRRASEVAASAHIRARRPVRLTTLLLRSLLIAMGAAGWARICLASAASAARTSIGAASHRRSSSPATK